MKFKRMIAMLLAGIMLLTPIAVNAAEVESGTGQNSLELDDSLPPSYVNVVLPTIYIETYEFKMDPQQMLHEMNSDFGEASMHFYAEDVPMTVNISSAIGGLYTKAFAGTSDLADFNASMVLTGSITSALNDIKDYYLWVPAKTQNIGYYKGAGEFIDVNYTNFINYFDTTQTSAIALKDKNGNTVTDLQIYTASYASVTSDFDKYIKLSRYNTLSLADNHLYARSGALYTEIADTAAIGTYMTVDPAEAAYGEVSDSLEIINKATTEILVNVKAFVGEAADLKFGAKTLSGTTDMLYLNLSATILDDYNLSKFSGTKTLTEALFQKATATSPIASSTISFGLKGADMSAATHYQGEDGANRGGHYYYQFEAPNVRYDSAAFTIAGGTNYEGGDDGVLGTLWRAYKAAAPDRATIKIVYGFENPLQTGPLSFTWGGDLRTFTLAVANGSDMTLGADATKITVKATFTGGNVDGNSVSFAGTGAQLGPHTGNKTCIYKLPDSWLNNGWSKIVMTGPAVKNKIVTLTKAGGEKQMGTVTVTVTEP